MVGALASQRCASATRRSHRRCLMARSSDRASAVFCQQELAVANQVVGVTGLEHSTSTSRKIISWWIHFATDIAGRHQISRAWHLSCHGSSTSTITSYPRLPIPFKPTSGGDVRFERYRKRSKPGGGSLSQIEKRMQSVTVSFLQLTYRPGRRA